VYQAEVRCIGGKLGRDKQQSRGKVEDRGKKGRGKQQSRGKQGRGKPCPYMLAPTREERVDAVGAREDETDCLVVLARFRGGVEGV
jgi:hypothetical protein